LARSNQRSDIIFAEITYKPSTKSVDQCSHVSAIRFERVRFQTRAVHKPLLSRKLEQWHAFRLLDAIDTPLQIVSALALGFTGYRL
jgi:hypothetical protein